MNFKNYTYAGIGSRRTPLYIQIIMTGMARWLEENGFTLHSGAAEGADQAFEKGAGDNKKIFIPWGGFNDHSSRYYLTLEDPGNSCFEIAEKYHPSWNNLKPGAKKLMARNSQQILGMDCTEPVDFVVCWTPEGKVKGGTGQALRIAYDYEIPVINLGKEGWEYAVEELINEVQT